MRDIDDGRAETLVQFFDLAAHGHTQFRIEVGQRLVEEEDLRVAHDGAAHGDTLALTTGELLGQPFQQWLEGEDACGFTHQLVDSRLVAALELQRKAHVLAHGHMRIKCVALEHHGNVPLLRRHLVDDATVDTDFAAADILQSRQHAQKRGLAAAGRADQRDEFAIFDIHGNAVDDGCRAVLLENAINRYRCHFPSSLKA